MKIAKLALLVTVVAFAQVVLAQEGAFLAPADIDPQATEVRPIEPGTYGTATLTRLYVSSHAFEPRLPATTWGYVGGFARFANGTLDAAVPVPAGASIEKIGFRGCDNSATEQVLFNFGPCETIGGGCFLAGSVSTGPAAAPGCQFFEVTLGTPLNVSATSNRLVIAEVTIGNSSATTFDAFFVDYRLRISDAPGAASFTDVPLNHLFFQQIEALKASGITAGCTATTFCPNQAVTRAEMAVFLARALGLHWAP